MDKKERVGGKSGKNKIVAKEDLQGVEVEMGLAGGFNPKEAFDPWGSTRTPTYVYLHDSLIEVFDDLDPEMYEDKEDVKDLILEYAARYVGRSLKYLEKQAKEKKRKISKKYKGFADDFAKKLKKVKGKK